MVACEKKQANAEDNFSGKFFHCLDKNDRNALGYKAGEFKNNYPGESLGEVSATINL